MRGIQNAAENVHQMVEAVRYGMRAARQTVRAVHYAAVAMCQMICAMGYVVRAMRQAKQAGNKQWVFVR